MKRQNTVEEIVQFIIKVHNSLPRLFDLKIRYPGVTILSIQDDIDTFPKKIDI